AAALRAHTLAAGRIAPSGRRARSRWTSLRRTRAAASLLALAAPRAGCAVGSLTPHRDEHSHLRRYAPQHRILVDHNRERLLAAKHSDFYLAAVGADGGNGAADGAKRSRNNLFRAEPRSVCRLFTQRTQLITHLQFRKGAWSGVAELDGIRRVTTELDTVRRLDHDRFQALPAAGLNRRLFLRGIERGDDSRHSSAPPFRPLLIVFLLDVTFGHHHESLRGDRLLVVANTSANVYLVAGADIRKSYLDRFIERCFAGRDAQILSLFIQ